MEEKILCINFKIESFDEIIYGNFTDNMKSIFEFDVVIINMNELDFHEFWESKYMVHRKRDFDIFFEQGGICFIFMPFRSKDKNFSWCPFKDSFNIRFYRGEDTYNINKEYKCFFINERRGLPDNKLEYILKYHFTKIPNDSIVLATNKKNDPISILMSYKNGKCIFLPCPEEDDDLVQIILDNFNIFYSKQWHSVSKPDWLSDFLTEKESELFKEKDRIERQLGKYTLFKQLLWATGDDLTGVVYDALIELDIDVTKLSIDSACDLEIDLGNDLIGVCEVKGLGKRVSKDDMRQLLDYYIEQRDFQGRNVRGIFIVNHYRDNKPEERDEPLNQGAKELSDRHQFKILTTVELYEMLLKKWQGKFSKEDLLKRLRS